MEQEEAGIYSANGTHATPSSIFTLNRLHSLHTYGGVLTEALACSVYACRFRSLAQREGIECCAVQLEVGDLYFFRCDHVHEVPAFGGDKARVVLATFIGWSEDDPRIFVWS